LEVLPVSESRRIVIIGASLAGAKAAQTLRAEGFDGAISLLGEESVRPYERPPLSKDYLQGKADADAAFVHAEGFYAEHDIDLQLDCRVDNLDPRAREVTLAGGQRLGYDRCLLTTGAQPRGLSLPGPELDGVMYLRTMAESDRLRQAITGARRVLVIGAGWIGCEVAASARTLGAEVAMVEAGALPLQRVLGPELGSFYRDLHIDHGVNLHLGVGVDEIVGTSEVEGLRLTDGTILDGDVVVVGVGVSPRVELGEKAGLTVDNGIITDEHLVTSDPHVFAAGDVANAWHPVFERRIRLEHWSSALNQGPTAARNMLGIDDPYTKVPYFFSDQYDVGMEYAGFAADWDEVVFRGEVASGEFIAFWLKGGRLLAGMNVNVWGVSDHTATLVAAKAAIDRAVLTDPSIDLAELAQQFAATPS
jgi:3-phenylpropionate/trans-cinnamate dioxygenase ferredoxin reductase subunit